MAKILTKDFFNQEPVSLAKQLLGKVLRVWQQELWLSAMIIETEAYYLTDKASHSFLGYTEKRKALFMPPGTIYMYYSRAGDSMNISCRGEGNAVLVKAAVPYFDVHSVRKKVLPVMQQLNPRKNNKCLRDVEKLCSGQTLLCKSLGLKVKDWDQKTFDRKRFFIEDVEYITQKIIQTRRLGIAPGRDEHLPYRFIDYNFCKYCTKNPLTSRDKDYLIR